MKKDNFHTIFAVYFVILSITYFIIGSVMPNLPDLPIRFLFFVVGIACFILAGCGYFFFRR